MKSKLTWEDDPTEKGHYWWRPKQSVKKQIIAVNGDQVFAHGQGWILSQLRRRFPEMQFAGPLPEPTDSSDDDDASSKTGSSYSYS